MSIEVIQYLVLKDNYNFILRDTLTNTIGVVDPSESEVAIRQINAMGGKLDFILNTHHHFDHIEGNQILQKKYNAKICAPFDEKKRFGQVDIEVDESRQFRFGSRAVQILSLPGHTSSHIGYYFSEDAMLFCGDVLFSLGCGKVFEGTHEQMYGSLRKIAELPGATKVYCAHEYTLANAEFALSVDPSNNDLIELAELAQRLQQESRPTIPTRVDVEIKANPFLRPFSQDIRTALGLTEASDEEVFAALRTRKDTFN